MTSRRKVTGALLGLLALVVGAWVGQASPAADDLRSAPAATAQSELAVRALSELPPEAAEVWALIQGGGPFPYEQDGTTFGNREGLLPDRERGWYREYTVPTPGEDDRGARRLVTGGERELYYTDDHYDSFVAVDPDR